MTEQKALHCGSDVLTFIWLVSSRINELSNIFSKFLFFIKLLEVIKYFNFIVNVRMSIALIEILHGIFDIFLENQYFSFDSESIKSVV